jgi:hypothetical protein
MSKRGEAKEVLRHFGLGLVGAFGVYVAELEKTSGGDALALTVASGVVVGVSLAALLSMLWGKR